jgi:DNA-binding protein YbaB
VKSITIADELLADKEQLEDYMILVLNKAIEKATKVNGLNLMQSQNGYANDSRNG